nr:Y-family DNA polymerase [uncultured Flavobacterium sp.]
MIALVDCNNFYVSCERVFQPQYNNKPVVVLSNNDGCVISRSEEAKKLEIPMGAPEFEIRDKLKQLNITVFSSNYTLYGDMSSRVMELLKNRAPQTEVYSIDEAFLNYNGVTNLDFNIEGFKIQKTILRGLGIPTCVGFAPTKALAKIANRIAKKFKERTQGIYIIDTDEKRIKALKWTKIEDVWGIGNRLAKKMQARQIYTALDFTKPHNYMYIKNTMGVVGERLIKELMGESVLAIEEIELTKKNIAVTRSFEHKINSLNDLTERISTFATICSDKLRKQKSCCYSLMIFIKENKHDPQVTQYHHSILVTLPYASNSALTLSNAAINGLKRIYKPGNYVKAGVVVMQLIAQEQKQFNLFEEEDPRHDKLMQTIDALNTKIGNRKIRIANQDLVRTWKMKQNFLSPSFTTNIKDIIQVKC